MLEDGRYASYTDPGAVPATSSAGSPLWATKAAVSWLFTADVAAKFCGAPDPVLVVDGVGTVDAADVVGVVDVDFVAVGVGEECPLLHPESNTTPTAKTPSVLPFFFTEPPIQRPLGRDAEQQRGSPRRGE